MSHLTPGDPAPLFRVPSTSSPNFNFDTVGGYRVILSFLGSSKVDRCRQVLQQFLDLQAEFEQANVPFFGVLIDPDDVVFQDQITHLTYCKLFWDFDRAVSQLYGVLQPTSAANFNVQYIPMSFVLNQNLQIMAIAPIQDPAQHAVQVLQWAKELPEFSAPTMATRQAPALFIPNVLDHELCHHLIQLYTTNGGKDSGFIPLWSL
ncbi:MAG: redoxin domain-containing protein [Oculatellaceae cyanobacterium bins.114]|nr:redoxin domain-containing protein [Oculatellaceae cyanobacterium bins.114]